MRKTIKALLLAGMVSIAPSFATTASAEGLVTIIVNDPSNPYWFTEGEVASKTAKELGYDATVGAHRGDTNTESNLIDTAITNKSVAIILDPANADGSIGAVRKAVDAGIPVIAVVEEGRSPSHLGRLLAQPRVDLGQPRMQRGALVAAVAGHPGPVVLVSPEVGLGVVPMGAISRRFVDESGRLHHIGNRVFSGMQVKGGFDQFQFVEQ